MGKEPKGLRESSHSHRHLRWLVEGFLLNVHRLRTCVVNQGPLRERPRSESAAFATALSISLLVLLGGFSILCRATLFCRRLLFQFVAGSGEVRRKDRGVGFVVLFAERLGLFV